MARLAGLKYVLSSQKGSYNDQFSIVSYSFVIEASFHPYKLHQYCC